MTPFFSEKLLEQLKSFPIPTQKKFRKQANFLLENLKHPSLRAKKYDEATDLWQARVDGSIRFYFKIEGNTCYFTEIKKHPK